MLAFRNTVYSYTYLYSLLHWLKLNQFVYDFLCHTFNCIPRVTVDQIRKCVTPKLLFYLAFSFFALMKQASKTASETYDWPIPNWFSSVHIEMAVFQWLCSVSLRQFVPPVSEGPVLLFQTTCSSEVFELLLVNPYS